jgi:hypothetical protein
MLDIVAHEVVFEPLHTKSGSKAVSKAVIGGAHKRTHKRMFSPPGHGWGKTALQQWQVFPRFGGSLGPFHMSV